jgi:hypothetical protein
LLESSRTDTGQLLQEVGNIESENSHCWNRTALKKLGSKPERRGYPGQRQEEATTWLYDNENILLSRKLQLHDI